MMETISLREIYGILKNRIRLILTIMIAFMVLTALVSYYMITPIYQTSTQLLISQQQAGAALDNLSIETDLQLMGTYSEIIGSPVILEQVISQLGLDMSYEELAEKVTVEIAESSQLLNIQVHDADLAAAVEIANRTAEIFEVEVTELMGVDNVFILSQAVVMDNQTPVSPNPPLNILLAAVVGLLVGAAVAFILQYLDTTLRGEQDIHDVLGIPVLGAISPMNEEEDIPANEPIAFKRREA
ncbi:Wzz/FepE/Etk N-terminal domain-containing protein [Microbacterium sp. APC 3898]|uniref:Wzz/FepE/Etk N-terminal domain-containing protein n=1 Tax=Planococcus notacanthi TaxID=3035188 RepID=A0ABT7ZF53_9BACL|nr:MULTISPECIES: Wzz/FepE/Etk N-terminal domain-containing protein [Terrabacteria group]MDN3425776.1 Wzz/FepE/Etk N-terminal domain-containing protein [Planococcus sp. APC 4016]MDN3500592.1 Wzz/FepE/Etk N-terminal domain-containing protein [Microbacterium sp. APC 3898]